MDDTKLEETRVVTLPNGYELEISFNNAFYEKVRKYFGLNDQEIPSDVHLREFFTACMRSI